jgi:hypothetical protein
LAELPVDQEVDAFLRESAWLLRLGVLSGCVLFALSPVLTVGRPVPSFWLSPERLDAHARQVSQSPIYTVRSSIFLIKMIAASFWGRHEGPRRALGLEPYPPDPGTWRTR